jgi:hypothetical protein
LILKIQEFQLMVEATEEEIEKYNMFNNSEKYNL